MSNKIGAKIVLEGEAEYRKALKEINSEQKELRSEMKLASSEFKNHQNSIEALTKKQEILSKEYETQSKKVEIYSRAVNDSVRKQEEAGDKVNRLKDELATASEKMESMAKSSDVSKDALAEQQKIVEELQNKLSLAEDNYSKASTATNNWKTSLNDAQTSLNGIQNELDRNAKLLSEAEESTDGAAKSVDEYGNEVEDAKKQTSLFADVLKAELLSTAITDGIKAISNGIKNVAESSVSVGKNFEQSMSQVAATMGITSEEIHNGSEEYKILEKAAEDAGKSTKYSASQSAEALNYLALAGYDASKSAETLPKVLNLASAGVLELATASDMVTDSMAALGMETSDLDKYIDEMARTSQKSNTSVAQLGEATLVCAGAVKMANMPLETMNAELGVLANNGIKGAEGGTHLRNVILSLVSPTDKGAEALNALGVSVTDSSGNVRDLNDILIDLNKSMDRMSDEKRTNTISNIFNKTDISAVNALLKGTGEEFDNLYAELSNCDGAAQDMANTMEDNLAGKITILQSALEGLGISAYDAIEDTLKSSVDGATESIGRLQDSMDHGKLGTAMDKFADSLGNASDGAIGFAEDALPVMIDGLTWVMDHADLVASGIAGITAVEIAHGTVIPVVTGAMEAWKAYKTANEGATVSQWALNTAMNANPAGLLVTAIIGLTAAVATYKLTTKDAKSEAEEFNNKISDSNNNIRERSKALSESKESHESELTVIQKLKEELLELNGQEELTTEQKMKMRTVVDELNQALPELNLSINEETGYLEQTNEQIENYINNMYESLKLVYMREDLEEAAKNLYEAEKNLAEISEEYNSKLEENEKLISDWSEAVDGGEKAMRDFNAEIGEHATDKIQRQNEAIQELKPTYEESQQLVNELRAEYEKMASSLSDAEKAESDVRKAMEETSKVQIEYKGKVYETTEAVSSNIDTLRESYEKAYEDAQKSIGGQVSLFEELKVSSDLSTSEMSAHLKTQTEAFNTYSSDLNAAAELVEKGLMDQGLLGAIKSLGIDGAGYLHELVIAAEEDTEAFNELMDEWAQMEIAQSTLAQTMADIETGFSEQMDLILGIQSDKNDDIKDELVATSDNVEEQIADTLDKMVSTTDSGLEDMVTSVREHSPEIKKASEELCTASIDGANEILQISEDGKAMTFVSVGYSIPEGIAQGIAENQDAIKNALQGAIDNAIDSIDLSGITSKINRELGDLY